MASVDRHDLDVFDFMSGGCRAGLYNASLHFLSRRPSLNELTSTQHKGPFGGTPWHRRVPARIEVLSQALRGWPAGQRWPFWYSLRCALLIVFHARARSAASLASDREAIHSFSRSSFR